MEEKNNISLPAVSSEQNTDEAIDQANRLICLGPVRVLNIHPSIDLVLLETLTGAIS